MTLSSVFGRQARPFWHTWLALLILPSSLPAESHRLWIRGAVVNTEIPAVVPSPAEVAPGTYLFVSEQGEEPFAVQVFRDAGETWLAMILPPSRGQATARQGRLVPSTQTDGDQAVTIVPKGENLGIFLDGQLFTEYRVDVGSKPFLDRLVGPTGASYTRAYPMREVAGEDRDHPHQRSFWFTHGDVDGVDFWSEQGNHGRIRERSRDTIESGPVVGRLRTTNEWVAPDGRIVLLDQRVLTIYRYHTRRYVDFEIELRAPSKAVTVGDTKEGMFGLRVASSMDVDKKTGGRILNAEGRRDTEAWGQASPWVDYSGPVDGRMVGITVLNHPTSFRHPTTWHVRGYGLFAANPFGWRDFGLKQAGEYRLQPDEVLRLRYRIVLHDGEGDPKETAALYKAYADPPVIELVAP
jgi:hypothetical protein